MTATVDPTPEQLSSLASGSDEEGPIVMLNLLRFRERAEAVDGAEGLSGREAYGRYGAAAAPYLAAVGGEVLALGECAATVIGPGDEWDLVAFVRYPSRGAFLEMVGDPGYQQTTRLRTAALADSRLIMCRPAPDGAV